MRMRAASSFVAIPPVPCALLDAAGRRHDLVGELVDALQQHGGLVRAGVVVVEALDVGEQDHEVGANHDAHERGQRVVVAEPDLLDGGRVVLVHDRHDLHVEQPLERAAREHVGLPVSGVVPGQEDLRDPHALLRQHFGVLGDEADLADRGGGLQVGELGRAGARAPSPRHRQRWRRSRRRPRERRRTEGARSARRGPRGTRGRSCRPGSSASMCRPSRLSSCAAPWACLAGEECLPRAMVPDAAKQRSATGALARPPGYSSAPSDSNSKLTGPMVIVSPSTAPARSRACSTPARRSRRCRCATASSLPISVMITMRSTCLP